jgi:hypothetical protein
MSAFTGSLAIRQVDASGRLFELLEPLRWEVGQVGSGLFVHVPAGTVTDGVSSPRLLWWIVPPVASPVTRAAWLHDYLLQRYRSDAPHVSVFTRSAIDQEFRLACLACGASLALAWACWAAVRLNALINREWD